MDFLLNLVFDLPMRVNLRLFVCSNVLTAVRLGICHLSGNLVALTGVRSVLLLREAGCFFDMTEKLS